MQNHQPLALFLIGHAAHHEHLFGGLRQFVQLFLDPDVRHHLTADLAKTAETVGNLQESVLVHGGDIPGDVPAATEHLGGFLRLTEVALHDIGTAHSQQPCLADLGGRAGLGIVDLDTDTRQRMANLSALGAHLPETRGPKIQCVYRDRRTTFSAAVTFKWSQAEMVLESGCESLRKLFSASHDYAQTAKLLRWASAQVQLKEGRRGE